MELPSLLVIDDEPAIVRLIARAGKATGYQVLATSEHGEFRRHYETSRPAVIVLDLAIPGMDGVELIRFLATNGCDSKIIIISGFDHRILETALRLGQALGLNVAATLSKPIRMSALQSLLIQLAQAA